ncbi:hypothetical protein D3C71_2062150 [compost metagenome]
MARLLHAIAVAQPRLEECADPGLEQHRLAGQRAGQQRAAGQFDAVELIGHRPFLPHRARCVAEHRTTIELL